MTPIVAYFAGNLTDIKTASDVPLKFELSQGESNVFTGVYYPIDETITISLKNFFESLSTSPIPNDNSRIVAAVEPFKKYTPTINGKVFVEFSVLPGGTAAAGDDTVFMKANFLTWQPQTRYTSYHAPQWLRYASLHAATLKIKAYYADGTSETKDAGTLEVETLYTFSLNYGIVSSFFGRAMQYYDVWVAFEGGETFHQRYVYMERNEKNDDWFVFENSLGGFDTVLFSGESKEVCDFETSEAIVADFETNFATRLQRQWKKSTGHILSERTRVWVLEFFKSRTRYVVGDSSLESICVSEPKLESVRGELTGYEFTYYKSENTKYLNIPRDTLPERLEITSPTGELFFLVPRLNEFASAKGGDVLFPVQYIGSEKWHKLSYFDLTSELGGVLLLSFEEYEEIEKKNNCILYACLDKEKQEVTRAFVGKYPFLLCGSSGPKITVSINPTDVGDVKEIVAEGSVLRSEVSENKEVYTFTISESGKATIKIIPQENYKVKQLNVDKKEQGAVDTYTFNNVREDHTAYVWMEIDEEIPFDYLVRSDQPDVLYSSTHVVFKSIKADYPNGLTQDVTVECVKTAREPRLNNDTSKLRNELIFNSVLKDWNQDSLFTLTLDGKGMLTYNCKSLGGLRFTNVDNVIIRNVKFVNFCNYIEQYSPDEIAAVMFVGLDTNFCRNFFIQDCSFNGMSTKDKQTGATYTISTKYTENLSIVGSSFTGNSGLTFRLSNARLSAFTKNTMSGNYIQGKVGHAGFLDVSGGNRLIFEDNYVDGATFRENIIYLNNVDEIRLSRNTFKNGARVAELSANSYISRLDVDSNLFVGMVTNPIFMWIQELFSSSVDIGEITMCNNTFFMSGNNYSQFVIRMNQIGVGNATVYNNILVDPEASSTSGKVGFLIFKTLKSYNSGNNLFKVNIMDTEAGRTASVLLQVMNPDKSEDSITVDGGGQRSLSYLKSNGWETDSHLILKSQKLLANENSASDYSILPDIDALHPSNNDNTPMIDNTYRLKNYEINSRGYINLHGGALDEYASKTGYVGDDVSEKRSFSVDARYDTPGDSILLLNHNTLSRGKLVKWRAVGTQHNKLLIGKYVLLHALPELYPNGEYKTDELYTIEIYH